MSTIKVNTIENRTGSTLTLGKSGTTIQMACGATQTGFGRTGTVDWCTTAKTSPFTSESGKGYFVNTTSGSVTVTLPASPSAGDIVSIKDYLNTFDTNSVTVGRNGSKIFGQCLNAFLSTEGTSVSLIYVDATQGWINVQTDTTIKGSDFVNASGGTETTSGDYKIHTFTSDGTFQVIEPGTPSGSTKLSYMVVAGGGGTGRDGAGGGGAGGFREGKCSSDPYTASPLAATPCSALTASAGSFPITVGGGGPNAGAGAGTGSNSIFSTITSAGGGNGGDNPAPNKPGGDGGSGGGARSNSAIPNCTSGRGNTPPVSPPQGNPGGGSDPASVPSSFLGGGGGGATAAGAGGPPSGNGGAGATTSITGTPTAYAGGGGGASNGAPSAGSGGTGGGGPGGSSPGGNGTAGTTNTGGGGGGGACGGSPSVGGAGGSGIVVIRYKFQ